MKVERGICDACGTEQEIEERRFEGWWLRLCVNVKDCIRRWPKGE